MSDLRKRLIEAVANNRYDMHTKPFRYEGAVDAILPTIEAELQKEQREIARWIRDCQKLLEELAKANKLLEQTIEVLEGFEPILEDGDAMYHNYYAVAKPLLDNLKAPKKEGTE